MKLSTHKLLIEFYTKNIKVLKQDLKGCENESSITRCKQMISDEKFKMDIVKKLYSDKKDIYLFAKTEMDKLYPTIKADTISPKIRKSAQYKHNIYGELIEDSNKFF